MRINCIGLGALIMIAIAGCSTPVDRVFDFPLKNKPAPDFELTALDGSKVKLGDYRGKPVVLAFFAYQLRYLSCGGSAPQQARR